jgi:hypothetical protein
MTTFYKGLEVKYGDYVGDVDFISEQYITICLRRLDHKSRDVCILIYPPQWKDVELINGNRQSYEK